MLNTTSTNRAAGDRAANDLPGLDSLPVRVREIAVLRGLGYSFREIGRRFGVTPQAASVMLARHRRSLDLATRPSGLNNLSGRAANVLGRHGISSRRQALGRPVLELIGNERNCGRKTIDEIRRWLGNGDGVPAGGGADLCGSSLS